MNNLFLAMYAKLQSLMNREEGQDLVEYALLLSLIALAVITISKALGTEIALIFSSISTSIA